MAVRRLGRKGCRRKRANAFPYSMADYYPLITRAVEGLSENTPALRQAVYVRARDALMQHHSSLDPPPAEAAIARERRSLDLAVDRVEGQSGGAAERASSVAGSISRAPRPAPAPRPPTAPAAPSPARASSLAPRARDPAPSPARPRDDWRSPAPA